MIPFVELKRQFAGIENEIREAVDSVFKSAWYILGDQGKAFEEEFAAYLKESADAAPKPMTTHLHAPKVVGVGSGTDALHLALLAVGVGPGDEVITVPNTCIPTVAAISAIGATPVLVDVDPDTLTMDPTALKAVITHNTRAIVPVHLYGHPCNMQRILEVANAHDIPVVEDCAQAHGTEFHGKRCGLFGAAAAFSFYPTKNLGAYGDGGAVVTCDEDIAEKLRMLRNYGEGERYHHSEKGFNSRLDEMQAAVLRVKLRHLDGWNDKRRTLAAAYRKALADLPLTLPPEADWARHNYHLFVVRTRFRKKLMAHLKEQDITAFMHYPVPVHRQKAYADLGIARGAFPQAERACERVLSLPLYPELSAGAQKKVIKAIRQFFE
jgi:dTDP-4-amino-4,6-dideoxygalactose transaminase